MEPGARAGRELRAGRPASGSWRSRGLCAEASGGQGAVLPGALGLPRAGAGAGAGVGAAGRGSEAASISRPLPLARRRSLVLPLAHSDTHPASPRQPLRCTHSPAFP